MLSLRVESFKGRPLAEPLQASFDASGGTIGRSEGNRLFLPDPERHVSRIHAKIICRDGQYSVADQGSNPVLLNGRPVGHGMTAPIGDGDLLAIGEYLIRVFSEVTLAGAAIPRPAAAEPPRPQPPPARQSPPPGGGADPLGLFGGGPSPAGGGGSFDDLFGTPAAPVAAPAPAAPAAPRAEIPDPFAEPRREPSFAPPPASHGGSAAGAGIPDDFDPFADPFAAPSPEPAQALPDNLGLSDLGLPKNNFGESADLDSLFGLDKGKPAPDPLAGSPLGAQQADPGFGGASQDPMVAFGGAAPPPTAATVPDDVPEIHGSFKVPEVPRIPEDTINRRIQPRPAGGSGRATLMPPQAPPADRLAETLGPFEPAAPHIPEDTISRRIQPRSTGFAGSRSAGIIPETQGPFMPPPAPAVPGQSIERPAPSGGGARPPPGLAPQQPPPVPPQVRQEVGAGVAAPRPVAPAPPPAATGAVPGGASDPLLAALRRGLGAADLPIEGGVTPALMEHIGALIRESTQGTLDLLLARAMTKREVKAEMTMIVSKGNNPLKFSPNLGMALGHLFGPPRKGFMSPTEAMRDAYDDLRSHQFGFMAGMRAALDGVLHRFTPEILERRLTRKTVVDSVLPMNRKAKLWDLYNELYQEISREAEDDFQTLFGKEFLRAYEEQIALLEAERNRQA